MEEKHSYGGMSYKHGIFFLKVLKDYWCWIYLALFSKRAWIQFCSLNSAKNATKAEKH